MAQKPNISPLPRLVARSYRGVVQNGTSEPKRHPGPARSLEFSGTTLDTFRSFFRTKIVCLLPAERVHRVRTS